MGVSGDKGKVRGINMKKEFKVIYPTRSEKGFATPNSLHFTPFLFEYEHLLKELTKEEISLLHSFVEQFEAKDEVLFTILNDKKKFELAQRKYAIVKKHNKLYEEQFLKVHNFFNKHDSNVFVFEIASFYTFATYSYSDEYCWFTYDDYKDGPIPFTVERITENGIRFHDADGEENTVSPQALMYIRLLEYRLDNSFSTLKLNCKYDERLSNYPQLQASLAVLTDDDTYLRFLVSNENPITSLIETVISYEKVKRVLDDCYDENKDEMFKEILELYAGNVHERFMTVTYTCYLMYTQQERTKQVNLATSYKKKYDETLIKMNRQKERFDIQKEKSHQVKKQLIDAQLESAPTIVKDQSLEKELTAMKAECNDLKRQLFRQQSDSSLELVQQNKVINDLKEENRILQQKLQPLLKTVSTAKVETVEEWIAVGHTLIESVNEQEEDDIRRFFELFISICDINDAKRSKPQLVPNLFGYCVVSSSGHFITLAEGTVEKIVSIPENVYLSDGQFIQVTDEFKFVDAYLDFYEQHTNDDSIHSFSTVLFQNEIPYVMDGSKLMPISHPEEITLIHGQIVSFNNKYELVRYYRKKRRTLDMFEQSIKTKGHTPYFISKVLSTGVVVENVFTNLESYIEFEDIRSLSTGGFITATDTRIIHRFESKYFYELSSHYNKYEFATICEIGDGFYGRKLNKEVVIIRNVPKELSLQLDEVIRIDEHHQFLEKLQVDEVAETLEQRLARRQKQKESVAYERPEHLSPILIVGNTALSENYKHQLVRYGYDATTVDGFGPLKRIMQGARNKDVIVVCLDRLSHGNMYAIRDEFPEDKLLYTDREGAMQIGMQLQGMR